MATLSLSLLTQELREHAPAALRRVCSWLCEIDSPDPVRRSLNRALVPIYLLYTAIAIALALTYPDPWRRGVVMGAGLLCVLGLVLNRRGVAGPAVLTLCAAIGIALIMPADTYIARRGTLSLPGELLMPIVIAALFVSPRAGGYTCAGLLAIVSLNALASGAELAAIAQFNLLSGSTLAAITALLAVGAGQFTSALRRTYEANRELEWRVSERTAELAEANGALADAKLHIERVSELRVKEVAQIVHDARNQIMHIRAAADQLADGGMSQLAAQRSLDTALRSQQDMLDSLLEAALLDAGALVLYREPASIADLVEQAAAQVRPRFEQSGCALAVQRLSALPPVSCDARRIQRVLLNLLTNALSYTVSYRSGGDVRVEYGVEGEYALVRVTDNGVGIAPDKLPLVGQRLVRVVRGQGAPEGTGLGLSTSIEIVKRHGGQLRLLSGGLGSGTTAELRLPLTPDA